MQEKRWHIVPSNPGMAEALHASLGINPVLCKILVSRGITTYDKAKDFFRPSLNHLHDPYLMKDMVKAVDRILQAIEAGENIMVFGDYDVDGTTSVACMYDFLTRVYNQKNLQYYIPDRYKEGYGVSQAGIDHAHETGVTLIICLDCGIRSVELIAYAKTLGVSFIVCDHHLPGETLPDAAAILNPKQPGCNYPYKELCGCGVGYKLICAVAQKIKTPAISDTDYLDLVAIAIAADIVPMTGENRILAFYGLQKINTKPTPGIEALIKLAGLNAALSITNVVFVIAPRVNAAGRMGDAKNAVKLFLSRLPEEAMKMAEMLHSDNVDRKDADSTITAQALDMINEGNYHDGTCTTVVYNESWHKGVVGIVASRLIESHYRPTVVLTRSGDIISGSARSVPGFNLYEAIYECREYLVAFGGHFAAAGLSMKPESLELFKEKFEQSVSGTIDRELLIPQINIDAEITFDDITSTLYNIICQAEPYGPENMRPVFIARKVMNTGFTKVVKENHIRFVLKQGEITFTGIGFNLAGKYNVIEEGGPLDVVFTLDENDWNDTKSLQLKVIDFRSS
ncbi:MAG: single-stranded-DNA-specific exonuclease RecJ [Ferruginibacter sp.]